MSANTKEEIMKQYANEAASYRNEAPKINYEFERFCDLLGKQIGSIFPNHDYPIKVLDIGAGTGMLSERLLKEYPNADITMLDFSPEMLEQGKAYFAQNGLDHGNIKRVCSDFITKPLPKGPYELILSSYALHHIRTADDLKNVYQKIADALQENYGTFFCIDYYLENSDRLRQYQVENFAANLSKHFEDSDVKKWIELIIAEDTPATRYQIYSSMPYEGITRLLGARGNITAMYGMTKISSTRKSIENTGLGKMYLQPRNEFAFPNQIALGIGQYPLLPEPHPKEGMPAQKRKKI